MMTKLSQSEIKKINENVDKAAKRNTDKDLDEIAKSVGSRVINI